MAMTPVVIIGMGMSPVDLTPSHTELIATADVLMGGRRHLESFSDHPGKKREITRDLRGAVQYIRDNMAHRKIVVLTSGDPLFYGIGSYLIRSLGGENVVIHPNVSSVASAFARLKTPWHDALAVSLHGRDDTAALWDAVTVEKKIVVFTDPNHSPSWLAGKMKDRGVTEFHMWVLEQMGTPGERVAQYALDKALSTVFAEPNVVVLIRSTDAAPETENPGIGMPDDDFAHERGLITKAEVRAVTIGKLQLAAPHTLWDLGAGSGAVSIEAAVIINRGKIFAVEKNAARIEQIKANKRRFGVSNMQVVHATLPDGLSDLPRPDRVFIGGGGRGLGHIVKTAADHLNPGGLIVINTVILTNVNTAMESLKELSYDPDIVAIQISRGRQIAGGERLQAENPVFIISGKKPDKQRKDP